MEFVEGIPVKRVAAKTDCRYATVSTAANLTDQLVGAMSHIHRLDIVHGHIKTKNVVVMLSSEEVVLIDFNFGSGCPHGGWPRTCARTKRFAYP